MRNLARWCFNHRRVVLVAWLFIAIGGTLLSSSVGSNFNASFTLNGVDSTRAIALLQRNAPAASGSSNQIVIATRTGNVTDPAVRQSVSAMLARSPHRMLRAPQIRSRVIARSSSQR
jgi:putative drug exporter of the RND superfamily